jgi:hypothetical protein
MKRCVTCGKEKDESEYNWRYKSLGIRHPTCRECHKTYRNNWYQENKESHLENVKIRNHLVQGSSPWSVKNSLSKFGRLFLFSTTHLNRKACLHPFHRGTYGIINLMKRYSIYG